MTISQHSKTVNLYWEIKLKAIEDNLYYLHIFEITFFLAEGSSVSWFCMSDLAWKDWLSCKDCIDLIFFFFNIPKKKMWKAREFQTMACIIAKELEGGIDSLFKVF